MILVDTSIWIELLRRGAVASRPLRLGKFATCGPVVQEMFQGLREAPEAERFRRDFLALPRLSDPVPLSLFVAAADIYREGRAKGFSIRSSSDCLIAAIAIAHQVPVWHRDRDFEAIAGFTPLRTHREHPRFN